MSHFSLYVYGPDVDSQLEPFNEELETRHYLTPLAEIDTFLKESGIESIPELIKANLKEADPVLVISERYYDCLENRKEGGLLKEFAQFGGVTVLTCNDAGEYNGVTTVRSNGKWDWWVVGGRWAGQFLAKPGVKLTSEMIIAEATELNYNPHPDGLPSTAKAPLPVPPEITRYDALPKGAIDFEALEKEFLNTVLAEEHLAIRSIVKQFPPYKNWNTTLKECKQLSNGKNFRELLNSTYHTQPAIEAIENFRQEKGTTRIWLIDDEIYQIPEESDFLSVVAGYAWRPYAQLRNEVWTERGRMGWFGITNNETTLLDWDRECREFLANVPDDELITVVDCHY